MYRKWAAGKLKYQQYMLTICVNVGEGGGECNIMYLASHIYH